MLYHPHQNTLKTFKEMMQPDFARLGGMVAVDGEGSAEVSMVKLALIICICGHGGIFLLPCIAGKSITRKTLRKCPKKCTSW